MSKPQKVDKTKLQQLITKIDENAKLAATDLSEWDPRKLPGMTMRVKEASEALESLQGSYADYVNANSFLLFVTGPKDAVAEYARVAEEEGGTLTVSAAGLYREIATAVMPSIGDRRVFGVTQLSLLLQELGEIAMRLKIRSIPTPNLEEISNVPTEEDVVNQIRDIVRKSSGDQVNAVYLKESVVKAALEIRYTQVVVPVVVTDATADELKTLPELLETPHLLVTLENKESVTSEKVIETFKTITRLLKTKNP